MLLPPYLFGLVIPVLLLCIPYYFFSRWLEKVMQPRMNFARFLSWFMIVLFSAVFYSWLVGGFCIRFVFPKLFGN